MIRTFDEYLINGLPTGHLIHQREHKIMQFLDEILLQHNKNNF